MVRSLRPAPSLQAAALQRPSESADAAAERVKLMVARGKNVCAEWEAAIRQAPFFGMLPHEAEKARRESPLRLVMLDGDALPIFGWSACADQPLKTLVAVQHPGWARPEECVRRGPLLCAPALQPSECGIGKIQVRVLNTTRLPAWPRSLCTAGSSSFCQR